MLLGQKNLKQNSFFEQSEKKILILFLDFLEKVSKPVIMSSTYVVYAYSLKFRQIKYNRSWKKYESEADIRFSIPTIVIDAVYLFRSLPDNVC